MKHENNNDWVGMGMALLVGVVMAILIFEFFFGGAIDNWMLSQ